MDEVPDYVLANRHYWDSIAAEWVEMGERAWTQTPRWGIWQVDESELNLLPKTMTEMRAIELGCGTAYVAAWMARLGAEVVAIDNSEKQLETATRLAAEHGIDLELIHGNAESVPFPDGYFDFAASEYGVAIWADPYKWVPEAHRILKPGAELMFLGHHPLLMVSSERRGEGEVRRNLIHPYFTLHRADWEDEDDPTTEFNLPTAAWMRLFDRTGFDVVAYHEIQNPDPNAEDRFGVDPVWAHEYPSEQAWRLRKR